MKQHRPYKLEEYNSNWPILFEDKKAIIAECLGSCVLDIQHIGSTSIPGMIAKPQIDIIVIVDTLDHVREKISQMEKSGFVSRGNYTHTGEEYFTQDAADGSRLFSVHVYPKGNSHVEEVLAFRDYLRSHEVARNKYMEIKKALYQKHPDNYHDYDSGKHDIIAELKTQALEWYKNKK